MIYKWSKLYAILKVYIGFAFYMFYKRIVVTGKENIPLEAPVIFAPNHQNAMMDPIAINATQKRQNVFLARADAFKNNLIGKLLRKIKILPVYRIRDGAESLKKNDEIFDTCINILKHNKSLGLFPEGTHTDKRKLLPIKKAITRIAFKAEEENDFRLGIKVVPVGIYYSNYSNFRSTLQINYGEPINIIDYKKFYSESERKGTVEFNKELTKRLKSLIIDIVNDEFYEAIESLREIYGKVMVKKMKLDEFKQEHKFIADKKLIEIINDYAKNNSDKLNHLKSKIIEYNEGIKKMNLRNWIFDKKIYSWFALITQYLLSIVLLPIHIFGIVNNYPAYKIPAMIVKKTVKDSQFESTFKFGIALVLFPIYYIIVFSIMSIFIDVWWMRLVYISILPASGIIAVKYMIFHRKLFAKLRYSFFVAKGNTKILSLKKLHDEIIQDVDGIVDESKALGVIKF